MSIILRELTKTYGNQNAIDQISFQLKQGEVVGLLGPNGAGKSTTMKILTCFIAQSSGTAEVCGYDTRKDPLEVRRRVGYLPEHNPLYGEMYVKEYLFYIAGMYDLNKPQARLQEMIELTGLGPEQHKKIEQLSKGYRQRVGLAQALIHNPEVLILDEPTSGLDPNQLVDIRKLIADIGKQKTVILSTHIMQEVEALCKRVIIINRGKIVADDDTQNLRSQAQEREIVEVEFDRAVAEQSLRTLAGVRKVMKRSETQFEVEGDSRHDLRKTLFDFAVQQGCTVLSLNRRQESLESIFRQLTQKQS